MESVRAMALKQCVYYKHQHAPRTIVTGNFNGRTPMGPDDEQGEWDEDEDDASS